eukprot:TRINITY_DN6526_c0_g1_i1.p1 TRINITY_DN6526_c0_g1~~TRINITY_DN6526_c0_g1_i1.p1  ORF type:complete len:253 (+),score=47.80 TRINITY_DN6526_c0_g1_i1:76-759(+)
MVGSSALPDALGKGNMPGVPSWDECISEPCGKGQHCYDPTAAEWDFECQCLGTPPYVKARGRPVAREYCPVREELTTEVILVMVLSALYLCGLFGFLVRWTGRRSTVWDGLPGTWGWGIPAPTPAHVQPAPPVPAGVVHSALDHAFPFGRRSRPAPSGAAATQQQPGSTPADDPEATADVGPRQQSLDSMPTTEPRAQGTAPSENPTLLAGAARRARAGRSGRSGGR